MNDADHEAMGAMLYVGARNHHRDMATELARLREQNAKLREVLLQTLDIAIRNEFGDYIARARAVLAETE